MYFRHQLQSSLLSWASRKQLALMFRFKHSKNSFIFGTKPTGFVKIKDENGFRKGLFK
jgi:hypothetical protein